MPRFTWTHLDPALVITAEVPPHTKATSQDGFQGAGNVRPDKVVNWHKEIKAPGWRIRTLLPWPAPSPSTLPRPPFPVLSPQDWTPELRPETPAPGFASTGATFGITCTCLQASACPLHGPN